VIVMSFVASLAAAATQTLAATVAGSQGFIRAGSAAVTENAADSVPMSWVVPTASCQISMSMATACVAAVDRRSPERDANPCGLPRGFGPHCDPRPPRSAMRIRCSAASKPD
jgi:hypothetical protein